MAVDLDDLLIKTSRTFALAIPLLPEPTRRAVSVAYLLFRIADTFEDATTWPSRERIAALALFAKLIQQPQPRGELAAATKQWLARPPCEHAGYLELLRRTPDVVAEFDTMAIGTREILIRHTVRTAEGMAGVVSRADEVGNLRLASIQELKDYCYIVAGIVGELLTDCFLHDAPQLQVIAATLQRNMVAFGEALQLVNILKDAGDDARDGRVYLPANVDRAEVFALARKDLEQSFEYVSALQAANAPHGFLAFTALPARLAHQALVAIEQRGPGAKVPRADVASLMEQLQSDLAAGRTLSTRI
jgi:farnesyl-diphosphate farnesyltransferase